MDLTALSLRAAAARPRVLLATLPGGTAARLHAERLARLRDWPLADTPAQADLLLVLGPGSPALHAAVERFWQDMPAPRACLHVGDADAVEAAAESGRNQLGSLAVQRRHAEACAETARDDDDDRPHHQGSSGSAHSDDEGPDTRDTVEPAEGHGGHHHGADASDGGAGDPGGHHDGAAGNHDGHGGHDGDGSHAEHGGHGGGDMEMPGGLPMAERGEDRDGLMLDRLHVPLGPLLADWPAGLTVKLTLQGDVVQEADVEQPVTPTGGSARPFWVQPWLRAAEGEPVSVGEAARRRAAAHLDSLARLLSVAGWPAEAIAARRLRDDLLGGVPGAAVASRLDRFARRVGRSRTLAWLTRGIGSISADEARAAGASGPAARAGGDVTARYRQWLADVRRDVARLEDRELLRPAVDESPRGHWKSDDPPSAALIALLPRLLTGAELAAARLTVASLDPDLDELAAGREGRAHG
ncbi:hypothetical protein ACFUMJ_17590 [Streptomyces olivaceus]|uniref:hypothetical protein n=1 Tax=Streptomyces TaxID=1883 RepID=UPI001FB85764|nr:hypothetical protein [Streptomyces sp. CB09030]UOG79100.1 hypothetical protein L6J92_07750 [Streptomyces sp. CB09030]